MKEMKKIHRFRYPKLTLLFITVVLAYFIFAGKTFAPLIGFFDNLNYFGDFFLGMLLAYGFTATPAAAIMLNLAQGQNIFLAILFCGFGAVVGDLMVFHIIRNYFKKEIRNLSREKAFKHLEKKIPETSKRYLILMVAEIFILLPIPDEIGVTLFALYKHISVKKFAIVSYISHTIGISIIFLIGRLI